MLASADASSGAYCASVLGVIVSAWNSERSDQAAPRTVQAPTSVRSRPFGPRFVSVWRSQLDMARNCALSMWKKRPVTR